MTIGARTVKHDRMHPLSINTYNSYMEAMPNPELNSQFGLWPLALGDDSHDSRPNPARCLFKSLMRRALLVVEVVIAVVLEDGLRHDRVTLAQRGRSIEDFAGGVGYDVGFPILYAV